MVDTANVKCPNCGGAGMRAFYETRGIPVHSCMMVDSERAALEFPKRDLQLGFCERCGFVSNMVFDAAAQHYAAGYEEQQSFSPRFRKFQTELIGDLVERYDLRGKDVVEIGCGKGDFLVELCEAGDSRGVGIDPSCDPERMKGRGGGKVRFIAELYSQRHADLPCDFLCCRHTLEHIHNTGEFIGQIRDVIGQTDALVFIEVPDVGRVLREQAFWDIYYEHCSYYSLGSLARVFRANRFDVIELAKDFDDQYLLIVARPTADVTKPALTQEDDLAQVKGEVDIFTQRIGERIAGWRSCIGGLKEQGKRVAIWGSGSKCVSFLSTVGIADQIDAVIDINPHRHGKYLAGSGKQVVAPETLKQSPADAILVMNPIYCDEIGQQIESMGVQAELIPA